MFTTKIFSGDRITNYLTLPNSTRALIPLENGPIEVYNAHIGLTGNIKQGLIQIDCLKEGQTTSEFFYVRKGIILVTTLSSETTTLEIYVEKIREINSITSIGSLEKEFENAGLLYKKKQAELETTKEVKKPNLLDAESFLVQQFSVASQQDILKNDMIFFENALSYAKEIKEKRKTISN